MIMRYVKKFKLIIGIAVISAAVLTWQQWKLVSLTGERDSLDNQLSAQVVENNRLNDLVERTDQQLREARRRAAVTDQSVAELQRRLQQSRDSQDRLQQTLEGLRNDNREYLETQVPMDIVDYLNGNDSR